MSGHMTGRLLTDAEVKELGRIEADDDTQGLTWRVEAIVRAHVAAAFDQAADDLRTWNGITRYLGDHRSAWGGFEGYLRERAQEVRDV